MDWKPEDVSRWVAETLELPQYAGKFLAQGISGPTLLELNDESLLQSLGVENVFHRKKLKAHINMLRSGIVAGDGVPVEATRGRPANRRPASGAGTPRMPGGGYSGSYSAAALPRGGSGSIQRSYSANSRGPKTPLSGQDPLDGGSLSARPGQEGSVYSCYLDPDGKSTRGLTSYFGIDSPSYSRRGSFPREGLPGSGKGRNDLWTTAAKSAAAGPGSYDIPQMVGRQNAAGSLTSPRAKFGNAQRKTLEYVAPSVREHNVYLLAGDHSQRKTRETSLSPGAGSYNPQYYTDPCQKGVSMGHSPRLNYKGRQTKHWISERRSGPGPTDYRPQPTSNSAWRG